MAILYQLVLNAAGTVSIGFTGTPGGFKHGDAEKLLKFFGGCMTTFSGSALQESGDYPVTTPAMSQLPGCLRSDWVHSVPLQGAALIAYQARARLPGNCNGMLS